MSYKENHGTFILERELLGWYVRREGSDTRYFATKDEAMDYLASVGAVVTTETGKEK